MSDIAIRKAYSRDAEALARMTALAAQEDGLRPPALDVELIRAHGFGAMPLFESWVAERRIAAANVAQAVGCAIAHKGYDVPSACATLVVGSLYVAPEARGKGVARMIIAEIAERAVELGARQIMITTGLDNRQARQFFAAIGATETSAAMFALGRDQIEWLAQEGA